MLDLRVLDFSAGIAGPYCTKLLADAGADVVKVEPPGGDPLRRWSASGADLRGDDGALFRFLNGSKRSVTGAPGQQEIDGLVAAADLVVQDRSPAMLDPAGARAAHPAVTLVTISPFGSDGPWADRPATEFTLQAACGSTGSRGTPDRPPLAAGGRIGEWMGGSYAAVGGLAAALAARRTGQGETVDVSLLECMAATMTTFASVFTSFYGVDPPDTPAFRTIELPSIEPTSDGWVGFCTIPAQMFQDFLVLIERFDLLDDRELLSIDGRWQRREEFVEMVHAWTEKRTTDDIIEQASALRIPVAPVCDGETVLEQEHFAARGTFVENPAGFLQPRVPYRISGSPAPEMRPAPALGSTDAGEVDWPPRPVLGTTDRAEAQIAVPRTDGGLPLAGVRVADFTAFWAGPAASHALACLGADVIHVESVQRPDGMRFTTTQRGGDRWWEWCPVFHGANTNKRSITLDLNREEGRDLALRLIAGCDAVVENFTPRVMENFGLGWDEVHEANPRAVMVRMPGFGLDGPWRDRTGFAQTMEQVTGMAHVTGFADGPPIIPRGPCDPLAGMHAVVALLVALDERDRTGEGRFVEVTMVEAALNAAAEQVVEWSAYGNLLGRHGDRGTTAVPQGLYPCRGEERWLALAVETDAQWKALVAVLGRPAWAADAALATVEERRAAEDELDAQLASWAADQDVRDAVERLSSAGVPAEEVVSGPGMSLNPQLLARGFFETVEHPVVGTHAYPGLPFRYGDSRSWLRAAAPTLGQHNEDVLADLDVPPSELEGLRDRGVIGDKPAGV